MYIRMHIAWVAVKSYGLASSTSVCCTATTIQRPTNTPHPDAVVMMRLVAVLQPPHLYLQLCLDCCTLCPLESTGDATKHDVDVQAIPASRGQNQAGANANENLLCAPAGPCACATENEKCMAARQDRTRHTLLWHSIGHAASLSGTILTL